MRLLLAVWAAKAAAAAGRLLGKKSTSTPGSLALRICPDIIDRLIKGVEKEIIVTCGTNGKTTTNNLLYTTLTKLGYKVVCNRLGANMTNGIATALAMECSIFGRLRADYACLEADEAYAAKIFEHLTPDYMIITNLFRDQLDRYGEIDITVDKLKSAIAKAPGVKLILNGDDPLTAQFGRDCKAAKYFGISEKVLPQVEETKEGRFCTVCGAEQRYNYYHYLQLGDYYCPECGNKRPELDFAAHDVDISDGLKFTVDDMRISVNYRGFYNIYNVLAVYAAVSMLGLRTDSFNELLSGYKPQIGRMELFDLGKPVILNLAKNPAGFNQAIDAVLQDTRRKDIIVAINDRANDGRDVSWLWDVDFEKIGRANINTLTVTGIRLYDIGLRFKYSDIRVDDINPDMKKAVYNALGTQADVCYVLVNYTALFETNGILHEIEKEVKGGASGE